jgi:hypothetical protein
MPGFMGMDVSRIFIGLLFLAVGVALFLRAIVIRLRLEKEVKDGRTVVLNNFLPYWRNDYFTDKGNLLRKQYNTIYYALVVYSLSLFIYMNNE